MTKEGGDEVLGEFIPGGTTIDAWQWSLYHNPDHFARAEEFIPERWLDDPRFANDAKKVMQPFSIGPQNCIGKKLLWNFEIRPTEDIHRFYNESEVYLLWEKGPVNVYLTPRKSSDQLQYFLLVQSRRLQATFKQQATGASIYGAPAFLEHLRGEFAFVLYDSRPGNRRVIACRDWFGIKPLFCTVYDRRFLLVVESKAFLAISWESERDVHAMDGGWTIDDRTMFKGVNKIPPGHCMEVTGDGSGIDMVLGVRKRLVESILLRLCGDVPVAICLSGGIDPLAVAGIVTELARKDYFKIGNESATRTTYFSVWFPQEMGYNEFPRSRSAGSALRSMTEKWILREAVRPYITEKLYQRKKHTFLTPTKWPRDGALHNLFRTLLTRRAVEGPGFVDHGAVQDEVKRAFGDEADAKSSRVLCYVGSWVTLAQRFGVKKASVED
ncbi:hypothetical protein LY78DRAFT_674992 [Colletotrichum sublineola]|nr:hypothetical protein LY78DRAFT_674992 [Colletotrichum sublineola]